MADLTIKRTYATTAAHLFELITKNVHLTQWWGYESMTFIEDDLRLDRLGPWFSKMRSEDGGVFHLSGQVTHITPLESVGFTWAWHDDQGERGPESHVTFRVSALDADTAELTIEHVDLSDDDVATRHKAGWTVITERLAKLIEELPIKGED